VAAGGDEVVVTVAAAALKPSDDRVAGRQPNTSKRLLPLGNAEIGAVALTSTPGGPFPETEPTPIDPMHPSSRRRQPTLV
jgi:hypothetical protein